MPVDIPEIGRSELAPVYQRSKQHSDLVARADTVYFHEGRLVAPVWRKQGRKTVALLLSDLQAESTGCTRDGQNYNLGRQWCEDGATLTDDLEGIPHRDVVLAGSRRIRVDTYDEACQRAVRTAAQLLVVDGQVYERVREAAWVIIVPRGTLDDRARSVQCILCESGVFAYYGSVGQVFRADREAEAQAYAEELARQLGVEALAHRERRFRMLSPELLSLPDAEISGALSLQRMVQYYTGSAALAMAGDALRAYADLADLARRLRPNPVLPEADPARAYDLLGRFLKTLDDPWHEESMERTGLRTLSAEIHRRALPAMVRAKLHLPGDERAMDETDQAALDALALVE